MFTEREASLRVTQLPQWIGPTKVPLRIILAFMGCTYTPRKVRPWSAG